jgi:uncharacterized damage-inducible protein DinB
MIHVDVLKYPIGQFAAPAENGVAERAAHLDVLRLLPGHLKAAVAGLDDSQLDTPYREGGWTVRQLVHHVADSHANAYIRFKLALTEDWPTIKPYEEAEWAKLADSKLPIDVSLNLLTAIHERWLVVLESMREAEFERGYVHPVSGRQQLGVVLANYSWHSRHHTAHVTSLRSRMGW